MLLDEQGLVLVDSQRPEWLMRPVVPLSAEVTDELVAARSWGDDPPPASLQQPDLAQAVAVRAPIIFGWRTDDNEFQALARPLTHTPWSYVSALPVTTFDAPARAFLRNAVATALLALALGSAAVLLFARSFAAALRRVTVAAQGLAKGDASMERDAVNRLELQADLRGALQRNQFRLLYQPIVSLADGRVTGVEALLRWHHPTRGVVSPTDFISIAEEQGSSSRSVNGCSRRRAVKRVYGNCSLAPERHQR